MNMLLFDSVGSHGVFNTHALAFGLFILFIDAYVIVWSQTDCFSHAFQLRLGVNVNSSLTDLVSTYLTVFFGLMHMQSSAAYLREK